MQWTMQTFTYKTVDHCQLQADVYRSPGPEVRPALVWIHGGALIAGSRAWIARYQVERYLAAGFCVIAVDYRLAPETKLPAIIEDLQDSLRWVREQGPDLFAVDPQRLAVVGHSAGGYLALMAGFAASPRPKAVVSFYGYGDITGPWYSQPDPFYRQQGLVTPEQAAAAVGKLPLAAADWNDRSPFYLYCRQIRRLAAGGWRA